MTWTNERIEAVEAGAQRAHEVRMDGDDFRQLLALARIRARAVLAALYSGELYT